MGKMKKASKGYSAPKLIRYGDLAKLTSNGTGSKAETGTSPAQPNKHP